MTEENLDRIIIKLIEEKPNLRIKGGEKLHPIYEAILALFKQQFTDERMMEIIKSEDDLRRVLALDSIVDYIPREKREQFMMETKNTKDYTEILNRAALYIAGSKRMRDGAILQPVSGVEKQKYFLKAIKKANPADVYVAESVIPGFEKEAGRIKKRRTRRIISAVVLSAALGFAAYGLSTSQEIKEDIYLLSNKTYLNYKIHRLSGQVSGLEARLKTARTELGTAAMMPRERSLTELTDLESKKGFQTYEMLPNEFNKPGEPGAITKKIDEIQKKGEMDQLRFIYTGKDVSKVEFVYKSPK